MANDDLSILDIEHAVLVGEIAERQRDEKTGEWKYVLYGKDLNKKRITMIAKIGITGKLVFITVFSN